MTDESQNNRERARMTFTPSQEAVDILHNQTTNMP